MKLRKILKNYIVLVTAASMMLAAPAAAYAAPAEASVAEADRSGLTKAEVSGDGAVEAAADAGEQESGQEEGIGPDQTGTEPEEQTDRSENERSEEQINEPEEAQPEVQTDVRPEEQTESVSEDGASDGAAKAGQEKADADAVEEIIEEEAAEAPAVEYTVRIGNQNTDQYIVRFAEEDRAFSDAVLTFVPAEGSETNAIETKGELLENFAVFELPAGAAPLRLKVRSGGDLFTIDLAELEQKETKNSLDGYLAGDEETAALLSGESEPEAEEIVDEANVLEAEDLTAEALTEALGEPVLAKKKVVMIDPGHGGKDSGATWTWDGKLIYESHINLAISKLLKAELAKYGITAYLTRTDDTYLLWEDRVKMAAEKGAALLASVHIDSAGGKASENPDINGVSIFQAKIFNGSYNQENAAKGQKLAKLIIQELVNIGFNKFPPIYIEEITNTAGVNYSGYNYADSYKIIRYGQIYNVPSVIIEHGFIDSEHDYRTYLATDKVRQKVAAADAKAIASYLGVGSKVDEKPGWNEDALGRYYITKKGKMYHGWKTIGKYTYYFDEDGYVTTGTPIIDGAKYWFDTKGRQKTGWLSWTGMNLYFNKTTGKCCLNGKYKISGKYHLFNGDGVRYENGTPVLNGKKYYAKDGVLQTGWVKLSGMKLYFKPKACCAAVGFTEISEKTYYFNSDGVLQTGKFLTVSKKKYYADSKGVIASGWKTISGNRYYFDPENGNAAATGGWYDVKGKQAYFTSKGIQKNGFTRIGKYTYYLYKKGGMAVGTPIISGKKYYFTAKGHQKTGWIELAGMKLYFDPNDGGAAVLNGTITLEGITYRFNEDGVLIAQSNAYVKATDTNGIEYELEGTFLTDPQIGTDVTENQFFASVVYAECGSEDYCAQVACAMVILNRMNTAGFPDSLPFVVYKRDQFAVARLEGDQTEPALTRYLKAYRDKDSSVLQYIENAKTLKAVKEAKKIMQAYKDTGADRFISNFPYNSGQTDFKCLYFMTPAAFERLGLDYEKTNAVTCTSQKSGASTVFFDVWIKK